jgi:hypothetical protein
MCLVKAANGRTAGGRIVAMRGLKVGPLVGTCAAVCSSPASSVCLPINGPATATYTSQRRPYSSSAGENKVRWGRAARPALPRRIT